MQTQTTSLSAPTKAVAVRPPFDDDRVLTPVTVHGITAVDAQGSAKVSNRRKTVEPRDTSRNEFRHLAGRRPSIG